MRVCFCATLLYTSLWRRLALPLDYLLRRSLLLLALPSDMSALERRGMPGWPLATLAFFLTRPQALCLLARLAFGPFGHSDMPWDITWQCVICFKYFTWLDGARSHRMRHWSDSSRESWGRNPWVPVQGPTRGSLPRKQDFFAGFFFCSWEASEWVMMHIIDNCSGKKR